MKNNDSQSYISVSIIRVSFLRLKKIIMFLYDRVLAIIGETLMSSTQEELVFSLFESIFFQRKTAFYLGISRIYHMKTMRFRMNLKEIVKNMRN